MSALESNCLDTSRFEIEPNVETHFSWRRARMSIERTLTSWVRTAVALIGFGFALVKFLESVNASAGTDPAHVSAAPRFVGLTTIATGIVALIVALWEYRWELHYLWSAEFRAIARVGPQWHTSLLAVAVVLIAIGLFAFAAILIRLPWRSCR
jgi:putative membrane protein